jgi:hypothetical protein
MRSTTCWMAREKRVSCGPTACGSCAPQGLDRSMDLGLKGHPFNPYRRLSKDDECERSSSEAMIYLASICRMLRGATKRPALPDAFFSGVSYDRCDVTAV